MTHVAWFAEHGYVVHFEFMHVIEMRLSSLLLADIPGRVVGSN